MDYTVYPHLEVKHTTTLFRNSGPYSIYIMKTRAEKQREIYLPYNNDLDV